MTDSWFIGPILIVGAGLLFSQLASLERRLARLSQLEAKIDALLQHAGVRFDPFANVPTEVQEALNRGEAIVAIKRLRQATGLGLKEAKDYVDELRRRSGTSTRR